MAYINERYSHEEFEVSIEVLEPTPDECDFENGMTISIDIDTFEEFSLEEFKELIKWMTEKSENIEKEFLPSGKRKKERKCRACGCTDTDCLNCIEKTGKPCHWVEEDLCSACQPESNKKHG